MRLLNNQSVKLLLELNNEEIKLLKEAIYDQIKRYEKQLMEMLKPDNQDPHKEKFITGTQMIISSLGCIYYKLKFVSDSR
jgi:hypothetical protein